MTDEEAIAQGLALVRGNDGMCFWVDRESLTPKSSGVYDPWCFSDPRPVPTMSLSSWQLRSAEKREREMRRD